MIEWNILWGYSALYDLKIGVRLHDVVTANVADLDTKLKALSAEPVQLTIEKVLPNFDYKADDAPQTVKAVKEKLEATGKRVSVLSCYINPISPNFQREAEKFKRYIDFAAYAGIVRVGTETGSVVADLYKDYPQNRTEEVFQTLLENMRGLVAYAKEKGVRIGVEGVVFFPVYSAERMARFVAAFEGDDIDVIYDPVNLMWDYNYQNQGEQFEEYLSLLATKVRVLHLKDFTVGNGELIYEPLFHGRFDLDCFLQKLDKHNVQADIILEGTNPQNYGEIYNELRAKVKFS